MRRIYSRGNPGTDRDLVEALVVERVTPRAAFAAESRGGAQNEVDAAGEVALPARGARASAKPGAECARAERIEGVDRQPEHRHQCAQHQDLQRDGTGGGIDELGHQGQEEDRHLGVQQLDQQSLPVRGRDRAALGPGWLESGAPASSRARSPR